MTTNAIGLKELQTHLEQQDANGVTLFNMVVSEIGTDEELSSLVTHRSLLSLVLYSIDHQKKIRALANSTKSNETSSKSKIRAQAILHTWLTKNINKKKYKGNLDLCATDAGKEIKGLGRGFDWIRAEITLYRKNIKS